MSAVLRAMSANDVAAVAELEAALFADEPWSEASLRDELGRADRFWLVAEHDGRPVAYAGLLANAQTADVLAIAVAPTRQRTGLGRQLLTRLLAEARSRGCVEVLLEVRADNAAALELYGGAGFEQIAARRGYYAAGSVDALVLQRHLP